MLFSIMAGPGLHEEEPNRKPAMPEGLKPNSKTMFFWKWHAATLFTRSGTTISQWPLKVFCIPATLCGVLVRALDLQLVGSRFESWPLHFMQLPRASCSHTCASVTKQYNSVTAKRRWCSIAMHHRLSGIQKRRRWESHLHSSICRYCRWLRLTPEILVMQYAVSHPGIINASLGNSLRLKVLIHCTNEQPVSYTVDCYIHQTVLLLQTTVTNRQTCKRNYTGKLQQKTVASPHRKLPGVQTSASRMVSLGEWASRRIRSQYVLSQTKFYLQPAPICVAFNIHRDGNQTKLN